MAQQFGDALVASLQIGIGLLGLLRVRLLRGGEGTGLVALGGQDPGLLVDQVERVGLLGDGGVDPAERLVQVQVVVEIEEGRLGVRLVAGRSQGGVDLTDGKEVPPEGTSFGTRNVPSIVLAGYRRVLGWAGVADSLWMSLMSIVKVSTGSARATGLTVTRRTSFFGS